MGKKTKQNVGEGFSELVSAVINDLYRLCYVVGLQALRTGKRVSRLALRVLSAGKFYFHRLWMQHHLRARRAALHRRHHRNRPSFAATAFHYLFPAASLALLALTVQHFSDMQLVLSVEYAGETVGYIEDESVFDRAQELVKDKIINEDYKQPQDNLPVFQLHSVSSAEYTDVQTLSDRIISASGNEIQEACGLYIDGEFKGAVDDTDSLLSLLDSLLQPYRSGNANERVEFVNSIQIKDGLYPTSSIVKLSSINEAVTEEVQTERKYTVKANDAPLTIAKKNDIPYSTLLQLNPNIEHSLFIGDVLTITAAQPALGIQVVRTETYQEEIPYSTMEVKSDRYLVGYTAQGEPGKPGIARVTAEVTYIGGVATETKVIRSETIVQPTPRTKIVGTKRLQSITSDGKTLATNFIWPVAGGSISCGWMGYYGHTGMDIRAPYGTAIYASAPGTVVLVKRNWTGYGLHIILDHGGGIQTLYAHCSAISAKVGQYVEQGERIASVGSTGNSTGNHCHFEIRMYGTPVNPANYIGK